MANIIYSQREIEGVSGEDEKLKQFKPFKKKQKVYPEVKRMSIQLLVSDLSHSCEFYTKTLGFKVDFIYEDFYCGLIKQDCSIHLKLATPSPEKRKKKENNEHADIIFSITNIDDFFNSITGTSATVMIPLRQMPYGKEFYISDPDEYIIAFLEEG